MNDLPFRKKRPTPTWTALLDGGCKVEGFDFKRLSEQRSREMHVICLVEKMPKI